MYSTCSALMIVSVGECYFTFEALYIVLLQGLLYSISTVSCYFCQMLLSMHIYTCICNYLKEHEEHCGTVKHNDSVYELYIHEVNMYVQACVHAHMYAHV